MTTIEQGLVLSDYEIRVLEERIDKRDLLLAVNQPQLKRFTGGLTAVFDI